MDAQGNKTIVVRPLVAGDDDELLRAATLMNLNWCGERFTAGDLGPESEMHCYTKLNTRRGDFGFVAVNDGQDIAVVWVQFFTEEDPGFGFVETGVPELSLSVTEEWRGRKIGSYLLRRALDEATRRGIWKISLSVEGGNEAKKLYKRFGFRDIRTGDTSVVDVMVRQ